jgi:hypothetical protein
MDRYNSKAPFIDELPAATAGAHSVFQEKTTITILPMQFKPDGMWLTGKVTTPSSAAGAPNRFVIAFTPRGVAGSNQTGHTRGHGQGYWQVKVNGWAAISLAHFDAYVLDRFWPGTLVDSLPARSAVIPFPGGAGS